MAVNRKVLLIHYIPVFICFVKFYMFIYGSRINWSAWFGLAAGNKQYHECAAVEKLNFFGGKEVGNYWLS